MQKYIKRILNFISIFSEKQHPPKWPIKRIGIIIWGGIGDGLLFYPALKALRKHFKDATIGIFPQSNTVSTFFEGLYDKAYNSFKNTDRKIEWLILLLKSLRNFSPDVVIVNAANPEFFSGFVSYISGAKYRIGFSPAGRGFLLNLSIKDMHTNEIDRNLALVSLLGIKNFDRKIKVPIVKIPFSKKGKMIGFHPGSGKEMSFKRWQKEKFLKLGKMILDTGYYLVLLGTKQEKEEIEFLKRYLGNNKNFSDLSVLDDIRKTAYIVSQLDLLISNDTSIAHIASALNIPLIVIFGPSDEIRYKPFGKNSLVIKRDMPCRPCIPEIAVRCRNRRCLDEITPEEVFNMARKMLKKLDKTKRDIIL